MPEISVQRLRELLLAENKLGALQAGGVDNWQWYSDSLSDHGYFKFQEELENTDDKDLSA